MDVLLMPWWYLIFITTGHVVVYYYKDEPLPLLFLWSHNQIDDANKDINILWNDQTTQAIEIENVQSAVMPWCSMPCKMPSPPPLPHNSALYQCPAVEDVQSRGGDAISAGRRLITLGHYEAWLYAPMFGKHQGTCESTARHVTQITYFTMSI